MSFAKQSQKMDILNGPIWNKIPLYALPVAATGMLEQLFNASDVAIVGNFASTDRTAAIAAVGANSPVIGVILNLFIGISLGTNVVIANAIGRRDKKTVEEIVHTSVLAAFIGGILVTLLGEFFIKNLLSLLNVPADVFPYALLYIRIYLLGLPVIFLYNFEAAIFRSTGDTKVPLQALAFSGVLNVLLNLLFVICFKMTVNGIAIATVVLILSSGKFLLSLFNRNPQVIEIGYQRLVIIFIAYIFSMLYEVMSGYLRRFRISLVPAVLTTIGVCGTRIAWVYAVFPKNRTFSALMMAYPASLSITAVLILGALLVFHPSRRFGK